MMESPQLPYFVARLIAFNSIHPIKAWRIYKNISIDTMAEFLSLSVYEVEKMESSNHHLQKNIMARLADFFKVSENLVNIRYQSLSSHQTQLFNHDEL